MWDAETIIVGVLFLAFVILKLAGGARNSSRPAKAPKRKRYVMRGYGGGKNATSLHPRQAKQGKRIVYIPGIGYRHVQPGKKRR
jgi:hypothetical protein